MIQIYKKVIKITLKQAKLLQTEQFKNNILHEDFGLVSYTLYSLVNGVKIFF
jgi:hypothetical protein